MGAIPAGSGNALICDIFEKSELKFHYHNAIFIIIKGLSIDINVLRYSLEGRERPIYSVLAFTWGFIADTDIGSESLRFLGGLRFHVYAV